MKKEKIMEKIKDMEKVCIQSPSGLKKEALNLSEELKEKNKEVFLISEPCFGACDLADHKSKVLGCDCLLHLGHSPFYKKGKKLKGEILVFYIEKKRDWKIAEVLEENIDSIKEKRIGIVSTVQHLHKLKKAEKIIEKNDKEALIGEKGAKTNQKGQVLGCDVSSAARIKEKVDAFLVIGSGRFHALKVAELGKKVYRLDPLESRLKPIDPKEREEEKRKRVAKLLKYKEEKEWGIIASTKKGQYKPEVVENVKKKLESKGKETSIIAGDRILENDLLNYGIKIWVNTACPRMSDDFEDIAVVNPQDLEALK